MELLAPAGNVENFHTALQAGADGVYLGAPGINARNLSRDLMLEEIWAMVDFAHSHDKKVYLAANSLILERDLSSLIETLTLLTAIQPDALIVQDLALLQLVRAHFPNLNLHVSTLMGVCNSEAVETFAAMDCKRIVLARELTLGELREISRKATVELEVFVHGAMCYSFSGLCLFSSFLGGKSGLRGRCVQPCRRGYFWKGRGGKKKSSAQRSGGSYLFSMNDLGGFEAVPQLQEMGITSLKIEGRLRSANYVGKIVEAYRIVIDAEEKERQRAFAEATRLAEEAMGRRTSPGYFFSPQPKEAITPHQSGNLGLYLGRFTDISFEKDTFFGSISVNYALNKGDRVRLHIESSGERKGFTLHDIWIGKEKVETVLPGIKMRIALPLEQNHPVKSRVELFKLDVKTDAQVKNSVSATVAEYKSKINELGKKQRKNIQYLQRSLRTVDRKNDAPHRNERSRSRTGKRPSQRPSSLELWLRTDSSKIVGGRLPFTPDVYLLNMDKKMLAQSANIKRFLGKKSHSVVWALPPVIFEKDLGRYRKHIRLLIRSGYRSFQLGHYSQRKLFGKERVRLYGDYTLNLANSRALSIVAEGGLAGTQVAIELDRGMLSSLVQGYRGVSREHSGGATRLGMCVYGAPPLFTSRLSSNHLQMERTFVSPKKEEFQLMKREGMVVAVPLKPFSLLPYLAELQGIGVNYVVIDITGMRSGEKEMEVLAQRISGVGKFPKLPTFNYMGRLE